MVSPATPRRDVYTVSRLNAEANDLLESHFPLIWVEGEISNLSRPASGHLYFTLKDARAQVRCAMFRNRNRHLSFRPENGMQVLVRAGVSLYQPRGDFQLIVEVMEEAGHGALQRAFEELKRRLAEEGLFDEALKQPLPALPRCIGVITSPSGAAIRDILSVLARRFPAVPVLVYPVAVQGDEAVAEIIAALDVANRRRDCDVLILARGGGSLEDLQAFNDERLARAIHASRIPVVSAVGHEIDFTIADFVADRRAPTPSAAAEMVVPDRNEWLVRLRQLDARMAQHLRRRLQEMRMRLATLEARLQRQHPGRRLRQHSQRLDELGLRLERALRQGLHRRRHRLEALEARLHRFSPMPRLARTRQRLDDLRHRLIQATLARLERARRECGTLARQLDAVSPLATLERGYAIVTDGQGRILRSAAAVEPGDRVEARLAHGRLGCRVEEILES